MSYLIVALVSVTTPQTTNVEIAYSADKCRAYDWSVYGDTPVLIMKCIPQPGRKPVGN